MKNDNKIELNNISYIINVLSSSIKPFNSKIEYTIANIFNKTNDENFLSYWFSYIFDPKLIGTTEFLNDLLNISGTNLNVDLSENIFIEREYSFDDGRRIDIIIHIGNTIIAIENKVWASLSHNQLYDYSKSLSKEFKNCNIIKIIMYPKNNRFKDDINKQIEKTCFIPVMYEDFLKIIKHNKINMLNGIRNTFMIDELIVYLENYICEGDNMNNINLEQICICGRENDNYRKIVDFYDNSKDIFINFIKFKLSNIIEDSDLWDYYVSGGCAFIQLFKKNIWNRENIHFELCREDGKFPIEQYNLVFHVEKQSSIKKGRDELINCVELFKQFLIDKKISTSYFIDYSSTDKLELSVENMINSFYDASKKFSKHVDDVLKSVEFKN